MMPIGLMKAKTRGSRAGMMGRKFLDRMQDGRMIDRRFPKSKGGIGVHVAAPSALAKFFTKPPHRAEVFFSPEEDV